MKKFICFILLTLFVLALGSFFYLYNQNNYIYINSKTDFEKLEELRKRDEYINCINNPYKSDTLDKEFQALFDEYQNKGVAIYFTEINNDYSYSLNSTKKYYSASTAKLFDAIYLIEKARNKEINLHDTITYLPSDRRAGSQKTTEHKFYDEIPLIDLISYALSVSDNAAHFMLVKYIGASTLNLYFKNNSQINLGITNDKPFIYTYTATMANESLKRIYEILKTDDEYSQVLRESLSNDYTNGLNLENITTLHKYGWYNENYHDIGIYEGENPYLISILTSYGNNTEEVFMEKTREIHQKIYNLYNENLTKKREYCLGKI